MNPIVDGSLKLPQIITEALGQGRRLLKHIVQISAIILKHVRESG